MRCVILRLWTIALLAWDALREESSVWAPGSNGVPTIITPLWHKIPCWLPHLVPMMTHFLTSAPNCWMLDDFRQKYWWPSRSTLPWLRLSHHGGFLIESIEHPSWWKLIFSSFESSKVAFVLCDAIQFHCSKSSVKTHTMPYTLTLSLPMNMHRNGKMRCDEQRVMVEPLDR